MDTKGKTIFAALYLVVVALMEVVVPYFDGGHRPDATEWVSILIAAVTAVLVYVVPLVPNHPGVKTTIGVVLVALQVLVTLIFDGINGNDLLLILVAVGGALGIGVAPAASDTGTVVPWGSDRPIA